MLMLLCWSAFISTLTLSIANNLSWIFPSMFFVGFIISVVCDPDIKHKQFKKANAKEEIKKE